MDTQMTLRRSPWGIGWSLLSPQIQQPAPLDPLAGNGIAYTNAPEGEAPRPFDPTGGLPPAANPRSFKSRIGAALSGLGSQLNPNGGGLESFLSGATGAYTQTQANLADAALQPYRVGRQLAADQYTDQHNAAELGLLQGQAKYYTTLANEHQANAEAPAPPTVFNEPGYAPGFVDNNPNSPTYGRVTPFTSADNQPLPIRQFAPTRSGATRDPALAAFQKNLNDVMKETVPKVGAFGKATKVPKYDTTTPEGRNAAIQEAYRRTTPVFPRFQLPR